MNTPRSHLDTLGEQYDLPSGHGTLLPFNERLDLCFDLNINRLTISIQIQALALLQEIILGSI